MSLQVLVIEDKGIVGIHIRKIIEAMGHKVLIVVKNGENALKVAAKNRVDLVISDIRIEGEMDGVSCAKELQEKYSMPVIFITAYRDVKTLKRASDVDFVGYLVKPFREDELQTVVNLAIFKYKLLEPSPLVKISKKYSYSFEKNHFYEESVTVKLTEKEHLFVRALLVNKNGLLTHEDLDAAVWEKPVKESARRQFIHRFKEKFPEFPVELIKNKGYRFF
jgi:DNA-binding response OmpR family regulator